MLTKNSCSARQVLARPITQADLAALTEKVRRLVVRWFRMQRLLDADAAAAMIARENSGFSVDASVPITLLRPHLRVSCQSFEYLLRQWPNSWLACGRSFRSSALGHAQG